MWQTITSDKHQPYLTQHVCRPQQAADARDVTNGFLAGLHPAPPPPTVQDLLLLVSELVTNALRHAGDVSALLLTADRHSIQVTVDDPSRAQPQDRSPDLTGRSGGFGWPMVRRLARSVSVEPRPGGGKAIRVTLPR
ncbi:ATP-binding protein [Streptomyces kronopolitis]|uniref:ATP-binding protein n=1 Tax=Streptomyces kronopolitis TaxID=1612435 RepID=UPI00343E2359